MFLAELRTSWQEISGIEPKFGALPLPFTSLPIHHSLVIPLLDQLYAVSYGHAFK